MIVLAMNDGPLGEAVGDGCIFLLCLSIGPNMCQMSSFWCVFLLQYPNDIAGMSRPVPYDVCPLSRSLFQDTSVHGALIDRIRLLPSRTWRLCA